MTETAFREKMQSQYPSAVFDVKLSGDIAVIYSTDDPELIGWWYAESGVARTWGYHPRKKVK